MFALAGCLKRLNPQSLRLFTMKHCACVRHQSSRMLSVTPCHTAGHSHYENTRHIKAAKDAARSSAFTKLAIQMKIAIREGGGNDPKYNPGLNALLQKCRKEGMPRATIERILQNRKEYSEFLIHIEGPGGTFLSVLLATTVQRNAKVQVQSAIKKSGFNGQIQTQGTPPYTKKRIITTAAVAGGKEMSVDDATDLAIEVGAEDVRMSNEEVPLLEFTCDEYTYMKVENALENQGLPVLSSVFSCTTEGLVHPSETDLTSVRLFLKAMHNDCSRPEAACKIVDVLHNVDEDLLTTISHV